MRLCAHKALLSGGTLLFHEHHFFIRARARCAEKDGTVERGGGGAAGQGAFISRQCSTRRGLVTLPASLVSPHFSARLISNFSLSYLQMRVGEEWLFCPQSMERVAYRCRMAIKKTLRNLLFYLLTLSPLWPVGGRGDGGSTSACYTYRAGLG